MSTLTFFECSRSRSLAWEDRAEVRVTKHQARVKQEQDRDHRDLIERAEDHETKPARSSQPHCGKIAIIVTSAWSSCQCQLFSRRWRARSVLEHSNVISAAERCKLGVGQIVITALFIVAIATSAKLPPGQYVPADDKLSIYLSIYLSQSSLAGQIGSWAFECHFSSWTL